MTSGYCTVVTGAAGGIGHAVVSRLLESPEARVVAVDVDAAKLGEKYGGVGNVQCVACDLTAPEGFAALVDGIKARHAGVCGFVHAAGVDVMAPLGMTSRSAMERLFAVHSIFPMQFLGWMAKKGNYAPGAAGVLISSLAAHEGAKGHVAYAAAKGAVEGLLRPAAAELADKGIRLNAVVLGVVETDMSRGWMEKLSAAQAEALRGGYPLGLGRPADAAAAIAFLLSRDSRWITGQTLVCDGGHVGCR